MTGRDQVPGELLVKPEPLAFRQASVGDVTQGRVADAPARCPPPIWSRTSTSASSSWRSSGSVTAGSTEVISALSKRGHEDGRTPRELAKPGGKRVQPSADDPPAPLVEGRRDQAASGPSPAGNNMPVVSMMKNGLPPAQLGDVGRALVVHQTAGGVPHEVHGLLG
jgi:hypothetical protein